MSDPEKQNELLFLLKEPREKTGQVCSTECLCKVSEYGELQ